MNMKKYLLTVLLALTLCAGLGTAALAADTGYTDVPSGHWAAESIGKATELGFFHGLSDGRFGVGQPISRAEFVTALVRLCGWETAGTEKSAYTDVPAEAWYAPYVETAQANGALSAAGREFHPEEAVTRSEMASMLLRSLGYTYLAGAASEYSVPFSDVTVNRGFITLAYDLGLMTGTGNGIFDPDTPATREQAATALVRVHNHLAAGPVELADASGYQMVSIAVPMAQPGAEIPITPLEPLTDLYTALRRLKYSGADMDRCVLHLTAGGVLTAAGEDGGLTSERVSAARVQEVLARPDAKLYYSDQYESAYCICQSGGAAATLWYQSGESLAAKLQLALLFGVTRYVME